MITAVAAIANGGKLMRPYIVQDVIGAERRPRDAAAGRCDASISEADGAHADGDDERRGGGRALARSAGIRVIMWRGRPEPAYISVPGGYAPNRVITSFIGFAPVSDPRMIVLVKIDEPQGAQLGGTVAAPVFAELAPKILSYLGVPPDAPAMVQGGG